MKKLLLSFSEFFLAKRVHIGLLAYVSAIFYMRCIGANSYHPLAPLVGALLVWSAYLENLMTDTKEDGLNKDVPHGISPLTESGLFRIERFYPLFYGCTLVAAFMVSGKCLAYTFLGTVIFSSYVQKWLPAHNRRWLRLKDIYIIKNIVPPIGWIFATGIIPFVASSAAFSSGYILLLAVLFLFSFREEIKFDIPDAAGDLQAGIRTFPNVLGETKTRRVLDLVNGMLVLLLFLAALVFYEYQQITVFSALLRNSIPFLMAFTYDWNFTDALFKMGKKEYCNVGILWWVFLLAVYMIVPYPYNIFVYMVLRFFGNLIVLPAVGNYIKIARNRFDGFFQAVQ